MLLPAPAGPSMAMINLRGRCSSLVVSLMLVNHAKLKIVHAWSEAFGNEKVLEREKLKQESSVEEKSWEGHRCTRDIPKTRVPKPCGLFSRRSRYTKQRGTRERAPCFYSTDYSTKLIRQSNSTSCPPTTRWPWRPSPWAVPACPGTAGLAYLRYEPEFRL